MYLDLLKDNIRDNYPYGYERVFKGVEAWLKSRGFKEDDFSDPIFVDKEQLEIMRQSGTQYGPGETVTIPQKEYQELLDADAVLVALETAGVENWEGYSIAMETLDD